MTGLEPLFPIWGLPTRELARDMIRSGIKAKLTCVDPRKLDRSYTGTDFDQSILQQLPPPIDFCGENGEFHTVAYDAPVFSSPLKIMTDERVERDGLCSRIWCQLCSDGQMPCSDNHQRPFGRE